MENDHFNLLALVAIVAIVAVISLVLMVQGGSAPVDDEQTVLIMDDAGNIVGEAKFSLASASASAAVSALADDLAWNNCIASCPADNYWNCVDNC